MQSASTKCLKLPVSKCEVSPIAAIVLVIVITRKTLLGCLWLPLPRQVSLPSDPLAPFPTGTLGESFFLIKKWPEEEDGRYVFTAFHFLLASLEVPSSKLENKFPTLLACIDFPSCVHLPVLPSAGPVVKPPSWAGLSGTSVRRWGWCRQET